MKFNESPPTISIADALAGAEVSCPCCLKNFITFLPFGLQRRANALCPNCYSLERHRAVTLYLTQQTSFFQDALRVFHVAPEHFFFNAFSKNPKLQYFPVDLFTEGHTYPDGTVNMDITDIKHENDYFDVILCNHVLEHIPDDRKAMAELHRVLKRGGWAILQVPLDEKRDKTFEDFTIMDPKEREKAFGQFDHVRVYGKDYKDRLEQAGFSVTTYNFHKSHTWNECFKYGLLNEDIYVCSK